MTLRRATETDALLLATLNAQLIQDERHRNAMTVPQLEERMRQWLRSEYQAVVCEREDQIVAYALFRKDAESVYLRQFFVKREWRRRGIGREAMRLLLDSGLGRFSRITVEVLAHNDAAHKFWWAIGFQDYAVTLELCRPSDAAEGARL
jgi:ribosomal protein S18 acetylase RimI-like enzyme